MPELIDSHCHLASFCRKGLLPEILERARENGVGFAVVIGTSVKDWDLNREMAIQYPETIAYTVGLHPTDVEEDWEEQVMQISTFFAEGPIPVGIGEIGLDHFRLSEYPDEVAETKGRQVEVFKSQLALARQFDCPVVVHSRDAFSECVSVIDESGIDWRKVVFHCFVEGPDEIDVLAERGGRASFTGIVSYKNAGKIREAARRQGLDLLMVETDAPYLAPEPKRGRRNEPGFVRYTAEYCASLLGVEFDVLAARTTDNARAFFGLASR
jgi:TatD DNase family protein